MSKEKDSGITGKLVTITEETLKISANVAREIIDNAAESKEDDIKVLGDNISEEDKSYFEKFGESLADQMEVVARESNLDSETMQDEFEELINNINNLTEDNEQYYIVETAQLTCSEQMDEAQTLIWKSGEITSTPKIDRENEKEEREKRKSFSRLRIPEDRPIMYSTRKPAVVKDTKGGFRDEIHKVLQGNKNGEGLNIISFGNCPYVSGSVELGDIAKELYDSVPAIERGTSVTEIEAKMVEAIKQGYGTCYCCMNLEPEWENLPAGFRLDTGNFYCESINKESTQQFGDIEAINMMSMLFCRRGGIITAIESGQKETANRGKFVGYLAYGCKSITQDPNEGYYMLYDGPTVVGVGDEHTFSEIYAKHGLEPNGMSGALQGYCGKKSGLNHLEGTIRYEGEKDYNPSNGVLYHDGIKRHAIAIGPQLQNSKFTPILGKGVVGDEMIYGACVDVTIELEGQTYYIPAVIVDTKGYTAPYGYLQTGNSFEYVEKRDISEEPKETEYNTTPNIVEWYVIKIENGKNKSEGLAAFNENGSIIIYRDEIALEGADE